MALPKLETPTYTMVRPSTGEEIKYRPFLVKEEKILMLAMESQDQRQALSAIVDTIDSCVQDDLNTSDLTTFDVEYMFTQIRAKSVGETIELNGPCTKCDAVTPVKVDFSKINVTDPPDSLIELAKDLKVQMRQPTYQMMLESDIIMDDKMPMVHKMFENVKNCMSIVYYGDEQIDLREERKEEIERHDKEMKEFRTLIEALASCLNIDLPRCSYRMTLEWSKISVPLLMGKMFAEIAKIEYDKTITKKED